MRKACHKQTNKALYKQLQIILSKNITLLRKGGSALKTRGIQFSLVSSFSLNATFFSILINPQTTDTFLFSSIRLTLPKQELLALWNYKHKNSNKSIKPKLEIKQ